MPGFLLGPLKALGSWALNFFLGWAIDKIKKWIIDWKAKQDLKDRNKKIDEQLAALDKQAALAATKEEIDEIRKRKIALEESRFNDTP